MRRPRTATDPKEKSPASDLGTGEMEVRLRGSAAQVTKQLTGEKREGADDEEKDGKGFVEALKDAKHIVVVTRIAPRTFEGQKVNVEVYRESCPLSLQDIQEEVFTNFGGKKYRIAVVDPESNETVDARVVSHDGDPVVPGIGTDEEDIFAAAELPDASRVVEDQLDKAARIAGKQADFIRLQNQLEELKQQRTGGGKGNPVVDERILKLEREIAETKHRDDLLRVEREAQAKIADLNHKLELMVNAKPQKDSGDSTINMILRQMQEQQKANQDQFNALLTKMQDDKMNLVLSELREVRKKGDGGGMTESVKSLVEVLKMLGVSLPGQTDEEDDEDDEDKPWYERLADKYLPKILDKFDGMEGEGKTVTKEDLFREIQEAAKQAEEDAVKRASARVIGPAARQVLPAPAPAPAPPAIAAPAPVAAPTPAGPSPKPVTELPPPPPAASGGGAPAPAPALPEVQKIPSIAEEICLRASQVLLLIDREMELRPRRYLWNYEGAWQTLPEPVLEKVCAAADPVSMFDALQVEGINPESIAAAKGKVAGNPKLAAWLALGLAELREWWAEKEKDPTFDPFEEEPEAEEPE